MLLNFILFKLYLTGHFEFRAGELSKICNGSGYAVNGGYNVRLGLNMVSTAHSLESSAQKGEPVMYYYNFQQAPSQGKNF